MAVMEGVMMKNKEEYAIAVRKPNNEIVVEKSVYKDFSDKVKLFKLPIFRGMLSFVDSMVVGLKVMNFSASFFEEEEEAQPKKKEKEKAKGKQAKKAKDSVPAAETSESEKKEDSSNALLMAASVLLAIMMSVGLFMVLPVIITNFFATFITNKYLLAFAEGVLRLVIFIGYVLLASRMPEIKRVFMYHGAEHKTINCIENGFELTVENVRWQSKQHKRCGTSFMLLVMLISLFFFIILPINGVMPRIISRILLVPFIAGISYEFIRLAGKSENKVINILSKPGLLMQGLTTKEPDDSMIEVAIESVGAVFDWRAFQETAVSDDKIKSVSSSATVVAQKSEKAQEMEDDKQSDEVTAGNDKADKISVSHTGAGKRYSGTAQIDIKPVTPSKVEEEDDEDDEILRALDKFFDDSKEGKASEGK